MSTWTGDATFVIQVVSEHYYWQTTTHRVRSCGCREEWATIIDGDFTVNIPLAMLTKNIQCPLAVTEHRTKWFTMPGHTRYHYYKKPATLPPHACRVLIAPSGLSSLFVFVRPPIIMHDYPEMSDKKGRVMICRGGTGEGQWHRDSYNIGLLKRMAAESFTGSIAQMKQYIDALLLSASLANL